MTLETTIGTLTTSTRLDLSGLIAGREQAKTILRQIATDSEGNTVKTRIDLQPLKEDAAKAERIMTASAERMKRSWASIGTAATVAGGIIVGALTGAIKAGAEYEQVLIRVAANTGMTATQSAEMRRSVESLGAATAAPLDKIAEGYGHIANFGFQAADANQILKVSTQAAAATGADASKTAELLAGALHNFGLQAGDSARTMDLLRDAAHRGNMTLEQFVQAIGPAAAVAHTHGVALSEVDAVMITLTQHQYNAAQAATQIRGAMRQIAEPSEKAKKNLAELSHISGVDLVHDFTEGGLRAKGLAGVLGDVERAANKLKVLPSDLIQKLVPGGRGGDALAVLLQNSKEFTTTLQRQAAIESGQVVPSHEQDEAAMRSLAAQTQIVKNNMLLLSHDVEETLLPALAPLISNLSGAVNWFRELPAPTKAAAVELAALAGVGLLGFGAFVKVAQGVAALRTAFIALQGAELLAQGGMLAALAPLLPWIAGAVAAAAAAYGLYRAFQYLVNEGRELHETTVQETQDQARLAQSQAHTAQETANLITRYEALRGTANRTTAQNEELRSVLNRISVQNPALVTGFDRQGNALGLVADAARRAADEYRNLAREATLAAARVLALQNQQAATQRDTLAEQRRAAMDQLRAGTKTTTTTSGGGYAGAGVYSRTETSALSQAERSQLAATVRELDSKIAAIDRQTQSVNAQMRQGLQTGDGARTRQYSNRRFNGMNPDFARNLSNMFADAARNGLQLGINSGYRSTELQSRLFARSDGSGRMVARPGHSQHEKGNAADLAFGSDAARQWVHANAGKYGLNFPMSYENWHIEQNGARNGPGGQGGATGAAGGNDVGDILTAAGKAAAEAKKRAREEIARQKKEAREAERDARQEARDKERAAEQAAQATDQVRSQIELLGARTELERKYREARKEFFDNTASGVPQATAVRLMQMQTQAAKDSYDAQARAARQEHADNLQQLQDGDAKTRMTETEAQALDALRERQKDLQALDAQIAEAKKAGINVNTANERAQIETNYQNRIAVIQAQARANELNRMAEMQARERANTDELLANGRKEREQQEQDAHEAAQETIRQQDRIAEYQLRTGQMDQQQYKAYLLTKLTDLYEYSDEYMAIQEKIYEIDKETQNRAVQANRAANERRMQGVVTLLQGVQGVFTNAFENLFEHGFKGFFSSILKGFEQMLAQMVAQWVAKMAIMGIVNLFTGGGAGASGIFRALGFDSGENDRSARVLGNRTMSRWGGDWAEQFGRGVIAHQRATGNLSAAGAGERGGGMTINAPLVHIEAVHAHNGQDADSISRRVAREVQYSLQGFRVGS